MIGGWVGGGEEKCVYCYYSYSKTKTESKNVHVVVFSLHKHKRTYVDNAAMKK